MTDTLDQIDARTAVTAWLSGFEDALAAGDVDAAAAMFADDSYWRDLIAFTWNIVTVEGPAGVRDLLAHTLEGVRPSGFRVADDLGDPTEGDGIVASWIAFETSVGRCVGHVRLKHGKAWTLLTTMNELIGHEEPMSERRAKGPSTARTRTARPGSSSARPRRSSWATRRSRTSSSSAAARAASRSAPGSGSSASRRSSSNAARVPVTPGATATSRSACTTPSGTTTSRTSTFRRTGRSSRRRTRSPTGSRCTRGSWSSTTGTRPSAREPRTTRRPRSGTLSSSVTESR